jgi:hypothetical protein
MGKAKSETSEGSGIRGRPKVKPRKRVRAPAGEERPINQGGRLLAKAKIDQDPQAIVPAIEKFLRQARTFDVEPTPRQIEQIRTYVTELLRWNEKINLTAAGSPEEVLLRHVLDALASLRHLSGFHRLLDVGTGGGLPGIPIKVFRPEIARGAEKEGLLQPTRDRQARSGGNRGDLG